MANSWYLYLGQGKDPLVPASYRRITVKPPCLDGIDVCAVYLLGQTATTPSTPFTINILQYISNGLNTLSAQPNGGAVKHFVYLHGS